jgi:formiminotetrahydrofolate cyclodeaminase
MEYGTRPIGAFLDDTASARLTPAGGTAAAVVGAIGTACCEMVCIHLEAAEVETDVDLADVGTDLEAQRTTLLTLAAADAEVVADLFSAPGDGADPETAKRSVEVPLSVAEACLRTIEGAATVTGVSDRPVVADAATGAHLASGALEAALRNARVNVAEVDDEAFVADTRRRATTVQTAAEAAVEATITNVDSD